MSLDNIQLPVNVLQRLYARSLYDFTLDNSVDNPSPINNIVSLGNNLKKIVLLVTSAEAIYLPDDELNFLLGILNACKLSMADVALINISKNPSVTYQQVAKHFKAEKIFLFGLSPEVLGLPLQFPHYQIQHFNNQVYLSSVSLTTLQTEKEEKLKLWNCLKKIFSLG